MGSSSGAGVRWIILGCHDFSAGTLSPSQPGLALTGRVEARLLYDLYSVDGGVKLLQKQTNKQQTYKKVEQNENSFFHPVNCLPSNNYCFCDLIDHFGDHYEVSKKYFTNTV